MIKFGVQPSRGAVAGGALLREPCGLVVRIFGAVEVLQVAAHAVGPRGGEIIVGMARRAFQPGMRAGKSEAGKFRVVEFRSQPAIDRMALLAVRGIANRGVVRITGPGKVA